MRVICIDASDKEGTGKGLLTEGKVYTVISLIGSTYYNIVCDNGETNSKLVIRFKRA